MTPQSRSILWVVPLNVAATAVFCPGHTGDQNAVGDERGAGHGNAVLGGARFDAPDFLSRLHIERNHARIQRGAEHLALVNGGTAVDDPTTNNTRGIRRIFDWRIPDLLAGKGVDRYRFVLAGDVHHSIVNERL